MLLMLTCSVIVSVTLFCVSLLMYIFSTDGSLVHLVPSAPGKPHTHYCIHSLIYNLTCSPFFHRHSLMYRSLLCAHAVVKNAQMMSPAQGIHEHPRVHRPISAMVDVCVCVFHSSAPFIVSKAKVFEIMPHCICQNQSIMLLHTSYMESCNSSLSHRSTTESAARHIFHVHTH